MISVFVDTSALIALKDSSDQNHKSAIDYFQSCLEGQPIRFVLTNYVMSEVHAYFCRDPKVALEYVDRLLKESCFRIIRASAADERNAFSLLKRFQDKTYSWADAVSFSVMERLGLKTAFAFDRHFQQIGRFRVLP